MTPDSFRFDGKRAVVVGGATGMGAAAAVLIRDLGADVVVLDHAPIEIDGVESLPLDLRDRESIETSVANSEGRSPRSFRRSRRRAIVAFSRLSMPPVSAAAAGPPPLRDPWSGIDLHLSASVRGGALQRRRRDRSGTRARSCARSIET